MSCVGLCSCVSYTMWHVFACVLVSLTLCVKCMSVFMCLLHCMSSVGLCYCVFYTVCHVLACVIASLTLCVMRWSVFLCLLH